MTVQSTEILGLQALAWLAGDGAALERFLAASGVDPAALRAAAEQPDTIAAVFDFLLSNEDLLLGFCDAAAIAPQRVQEAGRHLGGGD